MKRIVCFTLCVLLVFGLVGCDAIGTFNPGAQSTRPSWVEATVPPDVPEEELFKVTLQLNGESIDQNASFYAVFLSMEIYAQWFDGQSYYIARFDETGVARAAGLDGTYKVTLSDVPFDYIYDVNVYTASNDERQIVIDLYRLYDAEAGSYGDGTGSYYPLIKEFSDLGVYEIEIEGPDDAVFFQYAPGINGVYRVESWCSVAEDTINPRLEVWNGSVAYAYYSHTVEDGGTAGTYTANFRMERDVDNSEIGNVFIFRLRATAKDGNYPIKVKVAILRISDFEDRWHREMALPEEVIYQAKEGVGQLTQVGYEQDGRFVLDNDMCKLWPKAEGGDGFYHLYDAELYKATGGYGPVLYANVGKFAREEKLWIRKGSSISLDYRMFFRGFESLAEYRLVDSDPQTGAEIWGSELCSGLCTCKHQKLDSPSEDSGKVTIYACIDGCEKCHEQCVTVSRQHWGAVGYCEGANSDGYYPVTEELKEFMQLYAENMNLFCDGSGDYELQGIDADQDSMWLWGVRYYASDEAGKCTLTDVIKDCFGRIPNIFPSVS